MELKDKVVVITGGGNGIGAAMARRFTQEGAAAIVVADLDGDAAAAVADEIGARGMAVDVADEAQVQALVDSTKADHGRIDLFCANAGIGVFGGVDVLDAEWQRSWDVNVMAHVYAARALLPDWLEQGTGYLLHTASAAGLLTNIGAAPYSATKHAVVGLAEWLSMTHGDAGVTFSCLCPMGVRTNMLLGGEDVSAGAVVLSQGVIEPDDCAAAVVEGLATEKFLILPHPEVADFELRRATDHDRWLAGMRRLQAVIEEGLSRVSRVKRVLAVIFPLLFIGIFALGGAVLGELDPNSGEKSFSLEEIQVTAQLRPNGVLLVREQVTYDFDGTFNVGTRDFDSGPWEVRNMRVFEGDEELDLLVDSPTLVEWDISPASGVHTYELRYKVVNAVLAWPDVVELNWQWVGRDVPEPVGHHTVTLQVPGGGEGVRAWAHGPLSGTIEVDGSTIRTEIDDLPEFTFLETRVIAPRNRFDAEGLQEGRVGQTTQRDYDTECDLLRRALLSQQAQGAALTPQEIEQILRDAPQCQGTLADPIETEPQQDRIIAEETALADEANIARAAYAEEQQEKEDRRRNLALAGPFFIAATVLGAFLIWLKWGREPKVPDIDYWREVPDDPPAVAMALLGWGYIDTDAFSATVVDLAQRGYLTITETDKDHAFTATEASRDGLLDFENKVLKKLFEDGPQTSQKALTGWAKAHRTDAANWLESFKKQVINAYHAKGYQVKGQMAGWLLYLLLVGLLGGFAAIAIINEAYAIGGAAIGTALVLLFFMILLRRRTDAGAQRHAEWLGLKRFLKDFSQLQDAPSGHMALYERYLVAAVALDVADELVEALQVRIPEVANDPTFASWYVGTRAGAGIGSFHSIGDFSSGLSSATASSFRPPPSSSSSSGGGFSGGFSGGGGGGGGGGGFGAR